MLVCTAQEMEAAMRQAADDALEAQRHQESLQTEMVNCRF